MDQETYNRAKARVEEIKGFYSHLMSYVGVNVMLIVINLLTSPDKFWFYWVTIFWGFGVVSHGVKTFFGHKVFSSDWEEKKIRQIMEKEGGGPTGAPK